MSAYREAIAGCPECGSPLRAFGARGICDPCGGMMIGEDDLAPAVHELDGDSAPLVAGDLRDGERSCPRCGGTTTTCTLAIGKLALPGRYLRCQAHGVWVPRDVMTAVFARASRRGHAGRAAGAAYGGVSAAATLPGVNRGMNGALASIAEAFGSGPATSGLAISSGRGIAHVHSIYVSAYKDRTLACPSCGLALAYHGDRWTCAGCTGAFVENAALVGMIEDLTGAPWRLPEAPAHAGSRACPLCSAAMVSETIESVELDRCPGHGVWFDARELQALLEHAGTASHAPRGLGGWLARLFHRGS